MHSMRSSTSCPNLLYSIKTVWKCHSNSSRTYLQTSHSAARRFTTSIRINNDSNEVDRDRPRWQYTPVGMKAPVSLRSPKPYNDYHVNEDPEVLDQVYVHVLGRGGDKLLTDEVKWLAVTHKSFDQGRRGYNDRLAFLGAVKIFPCPLTPY